MHSCATLQHEADDECVQVPVVGTCMVANPRLHTIRIYFTQTATEEDSTTEAQFIVDEFMTPLYQKHPRQQWFVLADFSASDDASTVSPAALRLYASAAKHTQTAQVVCFNVQPGMHAIVTMLSHIPLVKNKVSIAETAAQAEQRYQTWAHGDPSLRMLPD